MRALRSRCLIRTEGQIPVARFCARLAIPRATWYYWRSGQLHGRPVRRWPSPVVDRVEERAAETAHKYAAWGHRKIWAMLRADGVRVSASSVQRALRRRQLLLPVRYQAERRQLAARRRETFHAAPTRRNRVWQTDFSEFETAGGGTWRISAVVDYATKFCLAATVVPTTAARDAIESLRLALSEAESVLGRPLRDDCLDPQTGELQCLTVVSDNGPPTRAPSGSASSTPDPNSATSAPDTTPRRPTASSSASSAPSSTSTCTASRSATSSSWRPRSMPSASSTTPGVPTRRSTSGCRWAITWRSLAASPTYPSLHLSRFLDSGHSLVT